MTHPECTIFTYDQTMMDAKDYVAVEHFDVLLTDLKAEDIARVKINDVRHLSVANEDTPTTLLKGTTFGENARILVAAVVSRSRQSECKPANVIMLVDTGCPYVFLTEKTWNSIGVKVENLPNDQAYIKINGVRVLAHVSSNHFEDIDVLGASFLKNCKMAVDYPEQTAELQVVMD
jgi:predicted aspartyl protease